MSKLPVFDKAGKETGTVDLPAVFATPLRPDVIRKAVRVSRANRRQAYGASPVAGERHATASVGKGRGMSRVPRLTQGRDAALAPPNVGGRRAHPPEARRSFRLKINDKERRLAVSSALAATADGGRVALRGHRTEGVKAFPLVVEDDLVALKRTKEVLEACRALGLDADLERAEHGTRERAGRGKLRGRRIRTPRSVLVVTTDGHAPALRNLPGVDVVRARDLCTEDLAPGGDAGRLTLFTRGALDQIKEAYA